jgi:hypothetical protein
MDPFVRNYTIGLAAIVLIALAVVFYESPKVGALNDRLAENAELGEYPYTFRVLAFDDGVATVTTPRSPKFNAFRALRILYPSLADEDDESRRLYDAQLELARVQEMAAGIVMSDPDVDRVRWALDERWLRSNGINPDLL